MPKLYVTKWVIARGILLVEGTTPEVPKGRFNPTSWVNGHKAWRYGIPLTIGKDAFLTLKEAQADARERFVQHLGKTWNEYNRAVQRCKQLDQGKLQVHENYDRVSRCHAFPENIR